MEIVFQKEVSLSYCKAVNPSFHFQLCLSAADQADLKLVKLVICSQLTGAANNFYTIKQAAWILDISSVMKIAASWIN